MHDKTTFTAEDKDGDGPFWPVIRSGLPIEPRFWTPRSSQFPKDARDSYAVIRHAVAKQGLPEDEHFFYRREMFYAGRYGPWFTQALYRSFGLISAYGHSVERPLAALAALLAVFCYYFDGKLPDPCPSALGLSTANTLPFFGSSFLRTYYRDCGATLGDTGNLIIASGLQTALSFILLFFLGLGLRQRFRLR